MLSMNDGSVFIDMVYADIDHYADVEEEPPSGMYTKAALSLLYFIQHNSIPGCRGYTLRETLE